MGQARTEMSPLIKPRYPLEEYFELERTSEEKYEYFNGEVVCVSREDPRHSLIEVNVLTTISNRLRESDCRVYTSRLRIKMPWLV